MLLLINPQTRMEAFSTHNMSPNRRMFPPYMQGFTVNIPPVLPCTLQLCPLAALTLKAVKRSHSALPS